LNRRSDDGSPKHERGTQVKDQSTLSPADYVYWPESGYFLGYLTQHPDHWTQGMTLPDLEDHLLDLQHDLSQGFVPHTISE
jgi:hypothetical protein